MTRKKSARPPQPPSVAKQAAGEAFSFLPAGLLSAPPPAPDWPWASSPLSALADHHGHPKPQRHLLPRSPHVHPQHGVLAHFGTGETPPRQNANDVHR